MNYDWPTAERLLRDGRVSKALELVRSAASNPEAVFQHATWHLLGTRVPRDLCEARRLLSVASAMRHQSAAMLEIALVANGSGAAPDWSLARRLLDRASSWHPVAARQRCLLNAMDLDVNGFPTKTATGKLIGRAPDICLYEAAFTPIECRHLATVASDLLAPTLVADPATGRPIPHPIRRSDGAVIGPMREDMVIGALNRRIAALTGTRLAAGEPLTVLRYGPSQEYRPHLDILPNEANQRALTVLIYLNHGFEGGGTRFENSGLEFFGRTGDAIVFRNTLPDGTPDPRSRHAGLPVVSGNKWLATRWIRTRALDVWAQHRMA